MTDVARLRRNGFLIAVLIFAIDRGFKLFVTYTLHLQTVGAVELLPFFDLRWTENFGVSLGMFTATSSEMRAALVAVTGAIALGVAVWMIREKLKGDIFGLALVLGGALGNIWDRVNYGFVIDYADLHIGEWRPFLIFNIADAAITFGVLILLARSLLSREKPAEGEAAATADHTPTETV